MFKSIIRFLKWQIGSRLVPGDVIYQWVNEAKIIVRPHETGLTQNIYCGLHEFEDMSFLLHVLRKDDLFVDVGANVGSYTVLACAAVGANGISIEPVPDTYLRLTNNVNINNVSEQVACINMGVADKEGVIRFTSDLDTMNHALSDNEDSSNSILVNVKTLDSLLVEKKPYVIKIDVEGFELPALMGAQTVLSNESLHAIIIELNNSGEKYGHSEVDIINKIEEFGFSPYQYDPGSRKLVLLNGKNTKSQNTLFIRNVESVEKRLLESPAFSVLDQEV